MKYVIFLNMLFFTLVATAQQKATKQTSPRNNTPNFTSKYEGGDIILTYNPVLEINTDSITVNVVRKGLDGEKQIKVNRKVTAKAAYKFADTSTRSKPGVYQYVLTASKGSTVVAKESVWAYAFADDTRPVTRMFRVSNIKETNNIVIKWSLENAFVVSSLVLKKSRTKDGKYEQVATLTPQDSLYVDKVDDSNEPFYYRLDMVAYNSEIVYQSVSVFVIPDFIIIPKTVLGVKAEQKNNAIYVSWNNADEFARGYYVKKRVGNSGEFIAASTIITKNRSNNYLWKDTLSSLQLKEMYQYVVVAESNSFNQSNYSDTATVSFQSTAKVLVPPTDLRVLTANDTTYNLVWSVDSLHRDEIAGYQVYFKAKAARDFIALKNGMVTSRNNSVDIAKPKDGDTFYVKALNGDKQSVASISYTYNNAFQNQFGPKYLKAAIIDGLLNIKWLKDDEVKFKGFKLYKWNGKSFALVEQVAADQDRVATKSYIAGNLNIYKLTTINAQGEESKGSNVLQVN